MSHQLMNPADRECSPCREDCSGCCAEAGHPLTRCRCGEVEAGHAEPSLFERSETETPTQGRIWADSEHIPQCDSLSVIKYCECGWKVEWALTQAPSIDAARKLAWSQFLLHLRVAQPSSQAGELSRELSAAVDGRIRHGESGSLLDDPQGRTLLPATKFESQTGEPERCPTCGSPAKAAKYCVELSHLGSKNRNPHGPDAIPSCKWCGDSWHSSSSQAQAGTPRVQAFWDAQAEWSRATFGSDSERDHIGPLKHLAKEAVEAQVRPSDPTEIADCLFLVFDAARRSGLTLAELLTAAEQKLEVNKARKWNKPAAGEAFAEHVRDEPIEHVRVEAQAGTAGTPMEAERFFYDVPWMHSNTYGPIWHSDANKAVFQFAEDFAAKARSEGAEAMRERAAKVAEGWNCAEFGFGQHIAKAIRALSLEMPDTPQKEKP